MSDSNRVQIEVQDHVATVILNRPEARNAINDELRAGILAAMERCTSDDDIRAVVLTGAGTAFCAGGDIAGMRQRLDSPPTEVAMAGWKRQRRTHHMVMSIHNLEKPTIAAVNGPAAGLGADLAFCCDFVVASESASFVMSYVLRGLIPDGGGMYWLPRRIGLPKAKEVIFSGRTVRAAEAKDIGMADRLVAAEKLLEEAHSWAAELAKQPPGAIALAKSILDKSFELTPDDVFALGAQAQAISYTTADHRSSVEAFFNRERRG